MNNSKASLLDFRPKSWLLILGLLAFSSALATAMIGEGFAETQTSTVRVAHRTGRVAGASVVADGPVVLHVEGVGDFRVVTNHASSPYQLVQLAEKQAGLQVAWRNTASGQELSSLGGVSAAGNEQWQATVDGNAVDMDARSVQPGMTMKIITQPR